MTLPQRRPNSLQRYLEQLHDRFTDLSDGAVATYIPELSKADPAWFGLGIVTVDGQVYQAGDSRQPFTIQSISKPFTYGMALEDRGDAEVSRKIDVEPSGETFNSISVEPNTGRPRNPMINAGAIVASSLVDGATRAAKFSRILARFSAYSGRELEVDETVYQSESATGHRNRAIAHLLRSYEILEGDPEDALEVYFRQCSILVTARDLAVMGATLANDGVNPITGVRALRAQEVPRVLSVMATCGMYDYSGNWIFRVGMPAKSGVAGGVVAVLPGQLGVACFSPRLDVKGNSVRGIAVCEALSREIGLHMLRVTRTTSASVIRNRYTGAQVRSKINRDPFSARHLDRAGDRVLVLELTGEFMFVSAEIVATTALEQMETRDFVIIDLTHITAIDQSATTLLASLIEDLIRQGKKVLIAGTVAHYHCVKFLKTHLRTAGLPPITEWLDVDHALEYTEDRLLEDMQGATITSDPRSLEGQPLCADLDAAEMALLRSVLREERYAPGAIICREGEPADRIFFLCSGRVSASLLVERKRGARLNGSATGWAFGESALFDGRRRTADIVAETESVVLSLAPADLDVLGSGPAANVMTKLRVRLAELGLERLARTTLHSKVVTN